MREDQKVLLVAVGIGVLLLLADRWYRIEPFLGSEGLSWWGSGPSPLLQRCGVGMAPCDFPLKCLNGFCRPQDTPDLTNPLPLPVVP
jgi:hypothetical protein